MSSTTTPEERTQWQKRLAAQANNRAWQLAELPQRSSEEDEEMLQAAYAASFFWNIVGNAGNRAHAAQLLAHVHALLLRVALAKQYLTQAQGLFAQLTCAPWEQAFAEAIAANVAACANEQAAHAHHYRAAQHLIQALADEEDRKILNATMRVIPAPVNEGS